jgi:hypothetical protein
MDAVRLWFHRKNWEYKGIYNAGAKGGRQGSIPCRYAQIPVDVRILVCVAANSVAGRLMEFFCMRDFRKRRALWIGAMSLAIFTGRKVPNIERNFFYIALFFSFFKCSINL